MAVSFGHNLAIGIAEETTFGTFVAPTKWIDAAEEALVLEQSRIVKPTLRSPSQNRNVLSKKSVSGTIRTAFGYEGVELLLKHALGAVATTGSGPYTHAFTLASALPTGLSVEVHRDATAFGNAFRYVGCQVSRLTITQEAEELLMVEAELMGKDSSTASANSPSWGTFKPIDWTQFSATLEGTALDVKSLEVAIENALADDRYYLGGRTRVGLGRNAPRRITGNLVLELDGATELNAFRNQTLGLALVLSWTDGVNSLDITIPNPAFQSGDPTVSEAGPVNLTLEWEALQNAAANDEMTLDLVNALASF